MSRRRGQRRSEGLRHLRGCKRESELGTLFAGGHRPRWRSQSFRRVLTASVATAHGAVRWRRSLATAVTDLRIQQAVAIAEMLPEQVLDAPEAARGKGGLLGTGGHVAGLRLGSHGEDGTAGREGAEEA